MAMKKFKLNKRTKVFSLFGLIVLFLALALIIPMIGAGPDAPAIWASIVGFFAAVKEHFVAYWMFYAFVAAVLFAYFGSSKK